MFDYAIMRNSMAGERGALGRSDGAGRTWTDTALVTAGSAGRGMHMEGAGGSGRGSSGEGKCRSLHIAVYLKTNRFVCCRCDEVSRSAIVVTTLLGNRSGSRRTVLPFLLSLVDGGDCAAHGLQISESLEIRQSPC
jgi:hypothetical protein